MINKAVLIVEEGQGPSPSKTCDRSADGKEQEGKPGPFIEMCRWLNSGALVYCMTVYLGEFYFLNYCKKRLRSTS